MATVGYYCLTARDATKMLYRNCFILTWKAVICQVYRLYCEALLPSTLASKSIDDFLSTWPRRQCGRVIT